MSGRVRPIVRTDPSRYQQELDEIKGAHAKEMNQSLNETSLVYDERFRAEIEAARKKYSTLQEEHEK